MSKQAQFIALGLGLTLGCSILFLNLVSSSHHIGTVDFAMPNEQICDVVDSTGDKVFHIYIPMMSDLDKFSDIFCQSLLAKSDYAQVRSHLTPRSQLKAIHLTSDPLTLVLSRHYFLQSILPGYADFYHEIVELPKYKVYWVSTSPVNKYTFTTAKIALLDDQRSQSGYMAPLKYLNNHSLNISQLNIQYFKNRDSMLNAFKQHSVDLLPLTSFELPKLNQTSYESILIDDQLELGSWFLHNSVSDPTADKIRTFLSSFLRANSGIPNE
ncbi:hypothetical protein ITG13_21440 [Vibrio cyclitrophicus]|nr:hypothetical protein [Vibrio cyclitrophicus]UPR49508.1 hypothetical protein ITG13_21440 [Vibrio cyclitrophicus]